MMIRDDSEQLASRIQGFDAFYEALMPDLVDFIGAMGVQPSHEVLRQAPAFLSPLSKALRDMEVAGEEDRAWLLLRLGYYLGEYFAQKFGGCWYVEESPGAKYFARYVVGQFSVSVASHLVIDPLHVAQFYVDSPVPRDLESLVRSVELELVVAN